MPDFIRRSNKSDSILIGTANSKKENSLNFLGDSRKSYTPSPILLAKYNIIQMGNKIELAWVKSNLDSTGDLRMNWIKNRQRLKCTGMEIKRLKDSTNIIW